ncbi:hypothetical protein [Thermococcus waiotapuensis]|uniref:Uncharacterized protein n=1 Tax=Thermococcus waiotapuensis TaxID=90909 RepID=A0AAE4NVH2_9EURY|nr:hypothetical protein [Thermococcus waiotapuensis]MDV3103593.1 hypothetical protein [Thermococcus waiotapuensis]
MGKETKLLEKLELVIPGFHGYKKKELLREDDRLVRAKVADVLVQARKEIERALQRCAMVSCPQLVAMDSLRKKLLTLEGRVRHAEAGYAGYFDRISVREEELENLIEYDARMIELAEEILGRAKSLGGEVVNPQALGLSVLELEERLRALEETLDKRMSIVAGE